MNEDYREYLNSQLEEWQEKWDAASADDDRDRMDYYSDKMEKLVARMNETDQ